ncbi:MAG TPA: ATP-binding cassette domain-containing protein [Negativicutes bacterium]|nr:ATP-binding cassette domain-containing protein [Negativicutes bacterium]
MIRIENLSKVFNDKHNNVHALKDISLNMEKGDIYGIIGLSGAGKSTLIRCINRLEEPSSGKVCIDGADITALDTNGLIALRRRIGMIFQHFNLMSRKSCNENIAFPLEIAGYEREYIRSRVDELLELVSLKDKSLAYPSQLSGGQKQRVAIARALATKPDILLCDEATSALDPSTTKSILELLKTINETLGITIVLITHQMEVIREICNKVAVISDGVIVEQGNTYDLFYNPQDRITKSFVRDISTEFEESPRIIDRGSRLIKLTFPDEAATQPVIWDIIRRFDIEVNIMAGHISSIQERSYGQLIISIKGKESLLESSIAYLSSKNLSVEVLNR